MPPERLSNFKQLLVIMCRCSLAQVRRCVFAQLRLTDRPQQTT
ncbi:hypothetical protein C7S15_9010 (plasmid) [Burkholderia cepacia]|nr:hypothetical protein [Burkholderia cepacia]